jgi:hypothetical protein
MLGERGFINKVKDKGESLGDQAKTKFQEVKTEAKSMGEQVVTNAVSAAGVMVEFPDFIPVHDFTTAISPELRRGVTSGSKRTIDDLPWILFLWKGAIVWAILITLGIFLTCFIALLIFYLVNIKPLFDKLSESWDRIQNAADMATEKIEKIKKDVEANLKEFWTKIIDDSLIKNLGKIQDWIVETLKKAPGFDQIDFGPRIFGRKKKDKRDTLLIESAAHSTGVATTKELSEPEAISIPITTTTAHPDLMPTSTIGNVSSVSQLATATANVSSVALTAGASHLSILPLFALLFRKRKAHQALRRVFQHRRASDDTWQAVRTWTKNDATPFAVLPGYKAPNIVTSEGEGDHPTFCEALGGAGLCEPVAPLKCPSQDNEPAVVISWQSYDLGVGPKYNPSVDRGAYDEILVDNKTATDGPAMLCNRYIEAWIGGTQDTKPF